MKIFLGRVTATGFGVAAGAFLLASLLSFYSIYGLNSKWKEVDEVGMIRSDVQRLSTLAWETQSLFRGFMLTGNPAFMAAYPASREGSARILYFADMDNLKRINDNLGHAEGDKAIQNIGQALKASFRNSDILGRLGGDEFVILTTNTYKGETEELLRAFRMRLDQINRNPVQVYKLDISVRQVVYDPKEALGIEALMARADQAMYEEKNRKKEPAVPPQPGILAA